MPVGDQDKLWAPHFTCEQCKNTLEGRPSPSGPPLAPRRDAMGAAGGPAGRPEPPDGGWGWVVLGAVFLTMSLSLPVPQSLGVFFAVLQDEFDASSGATAWVPSCMTATLHAAGPISSALAGRIGCRSTVMLGGLLTSVGLILASLSGSIGYLYAAAIVSGLGICLCFQPALTILGHYFLRRRSLANGVASSGTAVGICLLPLVAQALLSRYGWRGAFLIMGSLILNCCVCAALMRPVAAVVAAGAVAGAATPSEDARRKSGRRETGLCCCCMAERCGEKPASALDEAETLVRNGGVPDGRRAAPGTNLNGGLCGCGGAGGLTDATSGTGGKEPVVPQLNDDGTRGTHGTHGPAPPDLTLRCGGGGGADDAARLAPANGHGRAPADAPIGGEGSPGGRERSTARRRLARAAARANLDLFGNPLYSIFVFGTTLMVLGFFVPVIFLVPYAQSIGMSDEEAAALLSINGLINIFGRPVAGWVGGTKMFRGRSVYLYSGAAFLSGANNLLCGLLRGRGALLAFCVCHGLTCSVVGGVVFTVIAESIPAGRFAAALGLFTVLESVSFLVGPPAAGFLVDYTGTYSVVFLTCGVIVMVSTLFMGVATYFVRRRNAAAAAASGRPPAGKEPATCAGAVPDADRKEKEAVV
ncbi:monocarboxylate transporter 3-like isoform X1 [Lethenteron reissneri]|uniref:monocarboxylate transporter 3-like isoform X1 n=2 Tax=Lethenteron reissneri TaxID=7753 RepID=UPI002AB76C7F|nr:monocarboxylate transporter 3-like isoform X1 [Lethenteron reissneri]